MKRTKCNECGTVFSSEERDHCPECYEYDNTSEIGLGEAFVRTAVCMVEGHNWSHYLSNGGVYKKRCDDCGRDEWE